jgi:hypothetical protein
MTMANPDGPVFKIGDTVRLNELSNAKAKFHDRRGVIMGASRMKGKLRVLWNGLKRPQIVHATLLQLADGEGPAIVDREEVIATISEELEKIREARFEVHLKMPRPPQIQQPWSPRAPRKRWVLNYALGGIIGLTAAGIAIGAAYVLSHSAD